MAYDNSSSIVTKSHSVSIYSFKLTRFFLEYLSNNEVYACTKAIRETRRRACTSSHSDD